MREVASGIYQSLKGAKFNIYISPTSTAPVKDKEGFDLKDLVSGEGGAFYVDELNYGTYYVKETKTPDGYQDPGDKYFIITVDEKRCRLPGSHRYREDHERGDSKDNTIK